MQALPDLFVGTKVTLEQSITLDWVGCQVYL